MMEIYMISKLKYKFIFRKNKNYSFFDVETDPSLYHPSNYKHFTKYTPLLAPWSFLHNIQIPLLHFEVPTTPF